MRRVDPLRPLLGLALAAALVAAAPLSLGAAEGPRSDAAPARERGRKLRHPLPFKFGERLKYDIKFSRFPVYANVGELTFAVSEPAGSDQHVKFEVSAVSRGALVGLFNVEVNDVFTTLADRNDLFVYSSIKNLRENESRVRQESVFDRDAKKVRYTVSNLAAPAEAPSVVEAETPVWVQDVVSAVYYARTRKLENAGKEAAFYINDEGRNFHIGVAPVAREEIKTDVGTFKTLKVDVRIFNGRFVRRDGSLFVWLTDDARRIPVKAQLRVPHGTASFEITALDEGTKVIVPSQPSVGGVDDE
jgi:hypothetical protein